jgi:DNA-binding CsgD family transcriptional regulator
MKQKRLTDLQKIELVELFKRGKSSKELSDYFGITDIECCKL